MTPEQIVELPFGTRQAEPFVVVSQSWDDYDSLILEDGWAIRIREGFEWKVGMLRSHEFVVLTPTTPRPALVSRYHEDHLAI